MRKVEKFAGRFIFKISKTSKQLSVRSVSLKKDIFDDFTAQSQGRNILTHQTNHDYRSIMSYFNEWNEVIALDSIQSGRFNTFYQTDESHIPKN